MDTVPLSITEPVRRRFNCYKSIELRLALNLMPEETQRPVHDLHGDPQSANGWDLVQPPLGKRWKDISKNGRTFSSSDLIFRVGFNHEMEGSAA